MNTDNQANQNNFNGMHLTSLLFKNKVFIIAFTFLAILIASIIAFLKPNEYNATVSVVPPKVSSSVFEGVLGNISSTLRDIGLTKLGSQSEGYTFMVILTSRTLVDSMIKIFDLERRYDIKDGFKSEIRKEFIANYEVSIEKAGNYTVTIWDRDKDTAAMMANTFIRLANQKAMELSQQEAKVTREYLEERYNSIDSALAVLSDSLGRFAGSKMLIAPLEQAQAISSAISEVKAKQMESEIYYELFKNTYGTADPITEYYKNLKFQLTKQIDDIQLKPGFAGNFTIKEAAGIGILYMKLYTEIEAYSKVKAALFPMIEKARLDERRNAQFLFIVDEAVVPDKKDRPKRSIIIGGTAIGSFIFSLFLVIAFNRYNEFRNQYKELIKKIDKDNV